MIYSKPGNKDALLTIKSSYGNFINGEFVAPVKGLYFSNTTPSPMKTAGSSRVQALKILNMPSMQRTQRLMLGEKLQPKIAR